MQTAILDAVRNPLETEQGKEVAQAAGPAEPVDYTSTGDVMPAAPPATTITEPAQFAARDTTMNEGNVIAEAPIGTETASAAQQPVRRRGVWAMGERVVNFLTSRYAQSFGLPSLGAIERYHASGDAHTDFGYAALIEEYADHMQYYPITIDPLDY